MEESMGGKGGWANPSFLKELLSHHSAVLGLWPLAFLYSLGAHAYVTPQAGQTPNLPTQALASGKETYLCH